MKLVINKPDKLGAFASTLCMLHCFATPFLFIAQTSSIEAAPIWWRYLDYLFLVISFFAVYRSTQTTSNNFVKSVLWINWIMLTIMIINEKLGWYKLPETFTYISALTLIILHIYNLNYCQCKTDNCCTNQ
ncbi:MerC domain-containing protein [Flavobacteriaceae bacterium AU392]|nr:MerC domain-containing protein [Flavobacteriaceae bacterium]RKM85800.1 MerC domain-containing protein [Flavobacteriaceae bacterium AU392]